MCPIPATTTGGVLLQHPQGHSSWKDPQQQQGTNIIPILILALIIISSNQLVVLNIINALAQTTFSLLPLLLLLILFLFLFLFPVRVVVVVVVAVAAAALVIIIIIIISTMIRMLWITAWPPC